MFTNKLATELLEFSIRQVQRIKGKAQKGCITDDQLQEWYKKST